MKPTEQQIIKAVEDFGVLKYFPANDADAARKGVIMLLERMVGSQEQLCWLVEAMSLVGQYDGPAELRGEAEVGRHWRTALIQNLLLLRLLSWGELK
jgi:hypothetical protein